MAEPKETVAEDQEETIVETEETRGAEYESGWEEAEKAEAGEVIKKDEEPIEGEKKTEVAPAAAAKADEKPLTGIEKALHDTKSFATKLTQEVATLKKALDEKESAEKAANVKAAQDAQRIAQERLNGSLEAAYREYPELKDVLDTMKNQLAETQKELVKIRQAGEQETVEKEKLSAATKHFVENIKPKILEVHKDFDAIVNSPELEFFKWAEKQSPAIKTAVFSSSEPSDMIMALDRFKADKSSGYISGKKADDQGARETKLKNAQSLRGGVQIPDNITADKLKGGKDDYEGGWDEAGKALEKEGIK